MNDDLRARAESRLATALLERALADPRDAYRAHLRELRDADAELFAKAFRHYEDVVLPGLAASEDDPVAAWIEYGRYLAELVSPGTTIVIDGLGRATPYEPVATAGLVLHLPGERDGAARALVAPLEPSPAQRAAYDLLVLGRLGL